MNEIDTLVFSAGGVKLIAYVGAIKALSTIEILKNIKTYVGVSAGAIFAFLLNLGYNWEELYKISMNFDFTKFNNLDIDNFFNKYGLNDGKKLIEYLEKLGLKKNIKKDITFLDFYKKTGKKLIISATCLTTSSIEYFDYIKTPEMNIFKAIRLSISIPYYYTTEKYMNKLYIDGAVLEHIPLSIFKPSKKILGILLKNKNKIKKIKTLETFTYSLFQCIRNNMKKINKLDYNIFEIDTKDHGLLNFDINIKEKEELFLCGYNDIIEQLREYIELNNKEEKLKETLKEETLKEETLKEETLKEISKEDKLKEDILKEETLKEETLKEETLKEEI